MNQTKTKKRTLVGEPASVRLYQDQLRQIEALSKAKNVPLDEVLRAVVDAGLRVYLMLSDPEGFRKALSMRVAAALKTAGKVKPVVEN